MGRMTSKGNETPFIYANAEIRTRVVVISGPTRHQQKQRNVMQV